MFSSGWQVGAPGTVVWIDDWRRWLVECIATKPWCDDGHKIVDQVKLKWKLYDAWWLRADVELLYTF